jgi:hypothetical protein
MANISLNIPSVTIAGWSSLSGSIATAASRTRICISGRSSEQYHTATISPRKGNIYKEVLLAAALVQVDDLGYFAPADLRKPLAQFLEKDEVLVSLFGQHLKNLCEADRGKILEQTGTERRYRYRFVEPMMQPFILMQGLRDGRITREQVNALVATHYEPRFSSEF